MSDVDQAPPRSARAPIPLSLLDAALTAQIVLAWAGEGGDEPRLGWWRSDFVSEFGGIDFFKRLLPHTWAWAVLQGAREAARRKDAELRAQANDPDAVVTLFSLGAELDERIEERFQDLKRSGVMPQEALSGLKEAIQDTWSRPNFESWVTAHGEADYSVAPIGRLLKGEPPPGLDELVKRLVAALAPLPDAYPLPHFRRSR